MWRNADPPFEIPAKNIFRSRIRMKLPLTIRQAKHQGISDKIFGFVKSTRKQKSKTFLDLTDGSDDIQCVCSPDFPVLVSGTCIEVGGKLVDFVHNNKALKELQVEQFKILGEANDYPLHKGRIPLDILRQHSNLRSRTKLFQSIWKLRSEMVLSLNKFFKQHEFTQTTMPILTGNDCEGGGDSFSLSSKTFFQKPTYLTVSTQLHLEMLCQSLSRVYTIGPCFRAEKSNSTKHLAEFWMLEAEISFITDLKQLTSFVEQQIKFVLNNLLANSMEELLIMDKLNAGLISFLRDTVNKEFKSITYKEALEVLENSGEKFEFEFNQGLHSEHERFLAESYQKGPIFITNYPKQQKPFYMKSSEDEALCFDLIFPGWGEIVGGSLREDSVQKLNENLKENGLILEDFEWYLQSRKHGRFPHGGYGMGIERMLGIVTGMSNIKDLIPMPRFNGSCKY